MQRPNLLLFMPDQLRADCVGAFAGAVAPEMGVFVWQVVVSREHQLCGNGICSIKSERKNS